MILLSTGIRFLTTGAAFSSTDGARDGSSSKTDIGSEVLFYSRESSLLGFIDQLFALFMEKVASRFRFSGDIFFKIPSASES